MKKVIIFGIGDMAEYVYYMMKRDSEFDVVSFTVDNDFRTADQFCNLEVIDFDIIDTIYPPSDYQMFIAVGPSKMNLFREKKCVEAKEKGYTLISYVSKSAVCDSALGENCFVADFAVINPFVEIGNNNYFFEGVIVCNKAQIMDNCYIAPRVTVSSFSVIQSNSILGTGSIVKTKVVVGKESLIGASCYISKNTLEKSVYGEKCSEFYGCISHKVDISR